MRLIRDIAEIIIEAAWTRIGPVHNFMDAGQTFGFAGKLPHLGEALREPESIIQRSVDCIEICAAVDRNGFVARYAQLHTDTLEQRLGELENTSAQVFRNM